MDFPRATARTVSLLSVLFHSLLLSGGAQSLLNSKVSLPFLSVLTRRGGYSLGSSANRWSRILEVLIRGFCHWDRSLPKRRLYELRESWRRSSGCCRNFTWPWIGH